MSLDGLMQGRNHSVRLRIPSFLQVQTFDNNATQECLGSFDPRLTCERSCTRVCALATGLANKLRQSLFTRRQGSKTKALVQLASKLDSINLYLRDSTSSKTYTEDLTRELELFLLKLEKVSTVRHLITTILAWLNLSAPNFRTR